MNKMYNGLPLCSAHEGIPISEISKNSIKSSYRKDHTYNKYVALHCTILVRIEKIVKMGLLTTFFELCKQNKNDHNEKKEKKKRKKEKEGEKNLKIVKV